MEIESNTPESNQRAKTTVNAIIAALLTVLALWITKADFAHRGDLLFQSSPAVLVTTLFVSLLFLVCIVLAALPKRWVVGANLLILLRCALGFPLNIWLGNTLAARIVSVAFLILSVAYLITSLRRVKSLATRPWFQARHSVIAGLVWLGMGLLALPVWISGYAYGAQNLVGKYTTVSPKGVNLMETVFEKNGQKVHLVGMMHVGDGSYYSDLKKRLNAPLPDGGKRLVLTEGVSDKNHIIPEDFANGKTYDRWAKLLGIEAQKPLHNAAPTDSLNDEITPDSHVVWQNADMDVSDLSEAHRELLVKLLTLVSSADMTQMFTSNIGNVNGDQFEDLLINGLLHTRNNALMKRFNEMGSGFEEIYIPWGAAHLPDIEKRLLVLGYHKNGEIIRPVLKFWK